MTVIGLVVFALVYPGIVKFFPALLGGDLPLRNAAKEYAVKDSPLMLIFAILLLGGAGYGVWYGRSKNHPVIGLACSAFLLMVVGYSTYTQILVRSNANPPMNGFNKIVIRVINLHGFSCFMTLFAAGERQIMPCIRHTVLRFSHNGKHSADFAFSGQLH